MKLTAKTFHGLENVLAEELTQIGATNIQIGNRAVAYEGDKVLLYKSNYLLRSALRVLKPILEFRAGNEQQFYKHIQQLNWPDLLEVRDSIAIDAVVHSTIFHHSKFMALKAKDAIVDQFRAQMGRRPNVNPGAPTLRINIHIREDYCTVSLDSSGESLHRRGYRVDTLDAPINEVLAAGLILLSGWEADCAFIDPMCGSGTILIEATMIAHGIAPQCQRKSFGFQRWRDYEPSVWSKVLEQSKEKNSTFNYPILGFDKNFQAVRVSQRNIEAAGLTGKIVVKRKPFQRLVPPPVKGMLLFNPPYDERLQEDNINELYKMMGDQLKKEFAGYKAWIISSNKEAFKNVGLRPSRKITLYNGSLECKFQQYDMYSGSKKTKYQE